MPTSRTSAGSIKRFQRLFVHVFDQRLACVRLQIRDDGGDGDGDGDGDSDVDGDGGGDGVGMGMGW